MSPEEEERRRKERQERAASRQSEVAKSRVRQVPLGGGGMQMQAPSMQRQQNPFQQIGMQLGKQVLGSALGPLGGFLGGLFNEGGQVQKYNQGGSIAQQINWPNAQDNRKKQAMRQAQKQKAWWNIFGANPNRQKVQQMNQAAQKRGAKKNIWGLPGFNSGGMANPYGYNEGGQAMETPLKKVMEEDKIELARMAAMRAEERKDMKFQADEKRAQEKHAMEMKMKKQAATTKKAPLASNK